MALELRNWKVIAAVAGIVAVAVVTAVLVLGNITARDDDTSPGSIVVAVVNGDEITAEEVASVQLAMFQYDGEWLDLEEVLEQLISQKLILREAELAGYSPTIEEAEMDLLVQLADMGIPVELFHAMLEEDGLSYDEFLEYRRVRLAIVTFLDDAVEVPEVTEEEVMQAYEAYKELYMETSPDEEPPSFDEVRSQVLSLLEERRREDAISVFMEELRSQADIQYMQSE